ncbi:MAG: sigma-70 family RNA polymerase sigma factor [Thermoleophilia bacterium]|nr:sigma-70 family RNA polymerase sigma factor [Thermoleophilia bacterium]
MDDEDARERRMMREDLEKLFTLQYSRMAEFVKLERGLSRDARDDVLHDAFVRHCKEVRDGKDYAGVPLKAVARQLVHYAALDYFGDSARRGERETHPERGFDVPVWDRRPGVELWDLCRRLAGLPVVQRRAACLLYGTGLEHDQVAERLGMTRNAVDQALFRARTRLKASWDG